MLQPIVTSQVLDASVLSGVSVVQREHPQLSSHPVWLPCDKQILDEAATRTLPQNGCAWHLVRHGCVTASSCHLFLGFHEPAACEISIPSAHRKHSNLEDAVQKLFQQPSSADAISQNAFFRWGHEHEANALEIFLSHYQTVHVFQPDRARGLRGCLQRGACTVF